MAPSRALLFTLLAVGLTAWLVRDVNHMRFERLPIAGEVAGGWFSADPDGLYHVRRVGRALEEGLPPASFDHRMNAPEGAVIPWPPYYDAFLSVGARLFPSTHGADGAAQLERWAALVPALFGTLTSMLIAWLLWTLTSWRGALVGGLCHALAWGSIHTTAQGVADHHGFVAFLYAAMLAILTIGCRRNAFQYPAIGEKMGLAAGIIAGVLLGTWTASLVMIGFIQLWFFVQAVRDPQKFPGLPLFAATFHLSALAALLPAVLMSPWRVSDPWMLVNLSWFHPLWLLIGLGYFAPLHFLRSASREKTWARWFPVAGLALGAVSFFIGLGPASGLREAFAWSAKSNVFMAGIAESQSLWGEGSAAFGGWPLWLGWGFLLLPWLIWRAKNQTSMPILLLWGIVLVGHCGQAISQLRFSDLAALPIAMFFGLGISWMLGRHRALFAAMLAVGVSAILQGGTLGRSMDRIGHMEEDLRSHEAVRQNGYRAALDWLQKHGAGGTTLAHWDQGHALEHVAQVPTIATNFGIYLGAEGFKNTATFFTTAQWDQAKEILQKHKVRWVFAHTMIPAAWSQLGQASGVSSRFLDSIGSSLFQVGRLHPSGFLRLSYLSPFPDPDPDPRLLGPAGVVPAAWIWEVVPGATLVVAGDIGEEVTFQCRVDVGSEGWAFLFEKKARVEEDGYARLLVPYDTESRAEVQASGAKILYGDRVRSVSIPKAAVESGDVISVGGG